MKLHCISQATGGKEFKPKVAIAARTSGDRSLYLIISPSSDHYVTINYRNGFGDITFTPMNLTGCDVYQCPLDDFVR